MGKTNVMRILDREKIPYKVYSYKESQALSGQEVAEFLNIDERKIFKTLLTRGKSGDYYVFLLPVSEELDLKKASLSVNEKSIDMIRQKELYPLTGYVHGGCSPLAMKKAFPTVIDISVKDLTSLIFNGGKIGYQIEIKLEDLSKVLEFNLFSIV